jgi:hypothetical protein
MIPYTEQEQVGDDVATLPVNSRVQRNTFEHREIHWSTLDGVLFGIGMWGATYPTADGDMVSPQFLLVVKNKYGTHVIEFSDPLWPGYQADVPNMEYFLMYLSAKFSPTIKRYLADHDDDPTNDDDREYIDFDNALPGWSFDGDDMTFVREG